MKNQVEESGPAAIKNRVNAIDVSRLYKCNF